MLTNSKLKSYLGFSIKSNKIIFGIDNLESTKKNVRLVICCNTLADNSFKKLCNLCYRRDWKLVQLTNSTISELIQRENCRILGILDSNLANAIEKQENEIKIITHLQQYPKG